MQMQKESWSLSGSLKKFCAGLCILAGMSISSAQAEVTNVLQLKCSQVLPAQATTLSKSDLHNLMLVVFWLGGYEAGLHKSSQVDITRVQEIAKVLLSSCAKNPDKTFYELLQQADHMKAQAHILAPSQAQTQASAPVQAQSQVSAQAQSQRSSSLDGSLRGQPQSTFGSSNGLPVGAEHQSVEFQTTEPSTQLVPQAVLPVPVDTLSVSPSDTPSNADPRPN